MIHIPETYRSALSCGLSVAEDMLVDMSAAVQKARGPEGHAGELVESSQLVAIQGHIDGVHERIHSIRKELNLHRRTEAFGAIVLSRCSKMWQILCDLKTAHLRGYGETPPALPAYLDPQIDDILKEVDEILEAIRPSGHSRPQAHAGDADKPRA